LAEDVAAPTTSTNLSSKYTQHYQSMHALSVYQELLSAAAAAATTTTATSITFSFC